jgi:hypothetical protein
VWLGLGPEWEAEIERCLDLCDAGLAGFNRWRRCSSGSRRIPVGWTGPESRAAKMVPLLLPAGVGADHAWTVIARLVQERTTFGTSPRVFRANATTTKPLRGTRSTA